LKDTTILTKGVKMKNFEIGKTYYFYFANNTDNKNTFEIVGRTAKTVKVVVDGKVKSCRVKNDDNGELVLPLGNYSMAPVLRAKNEA